MLSQQHINDINDHLTYHHICQFSFLRLYKPHPVVFVVQSPRSQAYQPLPCENKKLCYTKMCVIQRLQTGIMYKVHQASVPSLMSPSASMGWSLMVRTTVPPSTTFSRPWRTFTPARLSAKCNQHISIVLTSKLSTIEHRTRLQGKVKSYNVSHMRHHHSVSLMTLNLKLLQ